MRKPLKQKWIYVIMWKKASFLNISCQSRHYMQSKLWLLMLYYQRLHHFTQLLLNLNLNVRVLSIWYIDDVSHLVNRFNVIYKISGLITFPVTRIKNVPWQQGSWGQHWAHLGPTGPRWAPCWPHKPCSLGHVGALRHYSDEVFIHTGDVIGHAAGFEHGHAITSTLNNEM